ncbi:MAG TPA: TetR/AcrR family transcriptional regulator [Candidatus Saccharimonadales bacterium]|nr:TetR/AcrR family transcriptional regulator [Candidatus Saccharimonadales bacterium]
MSKRTISRRQAGAARRQQSVESITSAAAKLFDLHGWYDVTLVDIAREARVDVGTVCNHFGTKRFVALAAYNSVLQRILADVRAEQDAREALITFVARLSGATWAHPVLALALLPVSRENAGPAVKRPEPSPDVEFVDFNQLAETLAELLNKHWEGRRGHPDHTIHAAEMYLSGMLTWTLLRHEGELNDAAASYLLYQVL